MFNVSCNYRDIRNENQTSKSPYGMGRRSFFRNLFSTWTIFEILRNNHINIVDNFEFMVTLLILTFISSYVLHKIFTFINKKL